MANTKKPLTKHLYRPLDQISDEIRVITFIYEHHHANEGFVSHDNIIRCQLRHLSIKGMEGKGATDSSPLNWSSSAGVTTLPSLQFNGLEYAALSYTWGTSEHTAMIELNGAQVSVTANLEAALRVLRDKPAMRQGCALWVDALCIDQSNLLERNQEVRRMRVIYKSAMSIVLWVGNEETDGAKALRLIALLSAALASGYDTRLAHTLNSEDCVIPPGSWAALETFMSRLYWTRVWILQEIALGNRSTPVMCGSYVVTWGEMYDALYHFTSRHIDVVFSRVATECSASGVVPMGLKRNFIIQLERQQRVQSGQAPSNLLSILDVGRKCMVSDPKDRIYGMLALLPTELAARIIPDYSKDVGSIYASFAKSMIESRQDLLLLEECTWPPAFGNPSWVPDWTNEIHFRLFGGGSTYRAALDATAKINFDDDDKTLSCDGISIGIVDGLGVTYYEVGRSDDPADDLQQPECNANPYTTESDFRTAVWQTLVGNRTSTGKVAPAEFVSLLQCTLIEPECDPDAGFWRGRATFNRVMQTNRYLKGGGTPIGSCFVGGPHVHADPPSARDALERMFRLWRGRRLVVTREGHMGLAPAAARAGDEIFVVVGCTVPVVMRPTEDGGYQVVGCCYLHGYMEGEALQEALTGIRFYQKIRTR